MAMAQVVYTHAAEGVHLGGALFSGIKFWFSARVPMRNHYLEQVKSNGGQVVQLEKQADILIVDHLRKDVAPGTHSWTYIDRSVKEGQLQDLQDHIAGPPAGTIRNVGSTTRPASGIRKPYIAEDDRILYDWVTSCAQKGAKILGNDIYKQLEATNSRHPWQSWRDRWVKQLSHRPPPAPRPDSPPPSSSSGERQRRHPTGSAATPSRKTSRVRSTSSPRIQVVITKPRFTEDDAELLLSNAASYDEVQPDRSDEAWEAWASEYPHHSALEWRTYFEERILLVHKAKRKERKTTAAGRIGSSIGKRHVANPTAKHTLPTASRENNSAHDPTLDFQTRPIARDASKSPSFSPESPFLPLPVRDSKLDPAAITPDQRLHKRTTMANGSSSSSRSEGRIAVTRELNQSIQSKDRATETEEQAANMAKGLSGAATAGDFERNSTQTAPKDLVNNPESHAKPISRSSVLLEHEYPSPSIRGTSMNSRSIKRKAIVSMDEPASSPARSITPPSTKRQRRQVILKEVLEIPSTPEKNTSSPSRKSTSMNKHTTRLPPISDQDSDQDEEKSDLDFGRAASETLSEPERHDPDTQSTFDNFTQLPDLLTFPEPEGGWDDDLDSEMEGQPDPSPKPSPKPNLQPKVLAQDTQAILNAPTQLPDFNIPDPDGGWETILPPSSPPQILPSSRSPAPHSAADINARLDAWIDSRVAAGISEDDVLLSLKSTTMHTGLADVVLKSLKKGKGVPKDVRGVWTAEDDRDLEASDGRVLKALDRKHGEELFDARLLFLADYRETGV